MKYILSYHDEDEIKEFKFSEFTVKIEKYSGGISRLYLVDNVDGIEIPCPENMHLCDIKNKQVDFRDSFFIRWFTDYSLMLSDVELLSIKNEVPGQR
jgi:hypothetical protein